MQAQLRQSITKIAKEKGVPISKLEREAGLHKNFINNFLYGKSNNPGIDAIAKIATILNVGLDELVGKESGATLYTSEITQKDILQQVTHYVTNAVQTKQSNNIKFEQFFNAIYQVYMYSLNKNKLDQEFADWFIKAHL